ncbi:MAG: hypothetical protein NZ895_00965 [Archaeoglobaceae archaeon]|nr:hypothetical protein [Archaeoglobaceae archaeon]MCX8151990.1 hypothetical protein [Archaeoglobaceae archaeon]MDW8013379.1 hypothetical protein [Archaeoglobaceae archaeon]
MAECEICKNLANSVCPRCYRYVCEKCLDPVTFYCLDCSFFRTELERDYERYLKILEKRINFMEKNRCYSCLLYKDELMMTLRRIKEIKEFSKLEMFEKIYENALQIEEKAQKLAIDFLVRLKLNPKSFTDVSDSRSKRDS